MILSLLGQTLVIFLEVWLILVKEVVIFFCLFLKLGLKYQNQNNLISQVTLNLQFMFIKKYICV